MTRQNKTRQDSRVHPSAFSPPIDKPEAAPVGPPRSPQASHSSAEKYKELVDMLPQMVYEMDHEGNFTFVNNAGLEITGYTREELAQGVNALEVVVLEDRARLAGNMARVLCGEKLSGNEYTAQKKDGTTFPVLAYSDPIVQEGIVVGIRGVCIDITHLKRAQDSLWINNCAMASSINAIALADLNGNLTYVNPSFLNMWGYHSPKEVIGKPATCLWLDLNQATDFCDTLSKRGWWIGELAAKKKDGTLFAAQLSATILTDQTGKPVRIMASFFDVTERKKAEEALRISEERFRSVFEGAHDCIYIKDQNLEYTHVNRAVEKLLGVSAFEIVGRTPADIFGQEAGKRIMEVGQRVLAGQSIEEEHTRPVRGEKLTFHEVTVPLRTTMNGIIGTCTISRNITERRKTPPVPRISLRDYPSPAMQATLEQARYAAARDSIVLLRGESGSGKDYVALWVHNHSRRAAGPFFAINCAALPHDLAESELFGHEPGAFTGARGRKRGLLELAEGGTILLNEIGELSSALQSKLLAFLDTRSFLRVGGEKNIHINARLMAATHRNLEEEVSAGAFLPALFYRLNVLTVHIPPLRERLEDLPILVQEIMSELASEMHLAETPLIDDASITAATRYQWPGNVRELRNVLERALMLWDKGTFKLMLPGADKGHEDWAHVVRFPSGCSLHHVTGEVMDSLCNEALRRTRGNKKEAARLLGISRYSLYRYLKGQRSEGENVT